MKTIIIHQDNYKRWQNEKNVEVIEEEQTSETDILRITYNLLW